MNRKRELIRRANQATLEYINSDVSNLVIHGLKLIGIERNIYRAQTEFVFQDDFVISLRDIELPDFLTEGDAIKILYEKIEIKLFGMDKHFRMEAYGSPEAIEDEYFETLDTEPRFTCENCGRGYEV